jgi:WD40 repeat protein/tetratricopeptide (TPR) repeat protein
LAADLGRWQRGEPVQARPPSLSYLLRKQVRRYRVPLAVAAGILVAAVLGIVAAFVQISAALEREKTANDLAGRNLQEADRQKKEAETALEKERRARADLNARLSQLAQSYCDRSESEFQKGKVRDGLNWMHQAYEVAPQNDVLRSKYLSLLGAQGRFFIPLVNSGLVSAVVFSPDGRTVTGGGPMVQLWDAATGQPMESHLAYNGDVSAVAFSPDGRTVLTGGNDKTARLWDAATGKPLGAPLRHERGVAAVAFSPDGRTVLTGSDDHAARLWDAATGKPLGSPLRHEKGVTAVAFSPDSRTALTGSHDKTARLWEGATAKPLGTPLRHEDSVRTVAFSPDGRTVLTGSDDKTARLWEAATGKPLGAPLRHEGAVRAAAFSPDGRTVLTGSDDKTAHLWEVATGKALGSPLWHEQWITVVAFSPDGRTVLTLDLGGTARLWDVDVPPPPDDPPRIRAWVGVRTGQTFENGVLRDLTDTEWLQHLKKLENRGGDWTAGPTGRRWHLAQAAVAEENGNGQRVAFLLTLLMAEDRNSPDLLRRRGTAYTRLREWDKAIADFSKAIELRPVDYEVWTKRAEARAQLGQWDQVVADYQEAFRLQPQDANIGCALAVAHLLRRDLDGYRKQCRQLLDRFGRTENASRSFVQWLVVMLPDAANDMPALVALTEMARRENPEDWQALETLGAALYRAGRFEESVKRLEEAAKLLKGFLRNGGVSLWHLQVFLAMAHYRLADRTGADRRPAWQGQLGSLLISAPSGPVHVLLPMHLSLQDPAKLRLALALRKLEEEKLYHWSERAHVAYLRQEVEDLLHPELLPPPREE